MSRVGSYDFGTSQPNSLGRNNDTFGVPKLTLHSNSWDWAFVRTPVTYEVPAVRGGCLAGFGHGLIVDVTGRCSPP